MDVDGYVEITEGKATILFPKGNEVFYNPVQEFNRDMSIAAIRTWDKLRRQEVEEKRAKHRAYKMPAAAGRVEAKAEAKEGNQLGRVEAKAEAEEGTTAAGAEPLKSALAIDSTPAQSAAAPDSRPPPRLRFKILEALSASGLRSVRYAKEISGVDEILANDLVAEAVESIKRNVEHNKLPPGLVVPNSGDAMDVMYAHRNVDKRFDVVDLDPYGSASQFIDGAVQSVANGGLLCVTCTDLGVLAGNQHRETCFAKYGSMTAKTEACHEMALRIVLNTLQTSAARYKRCIVPLLSCSIDFYVRLFVRVFDSAGEVKKAASNLSMVYVCHGCRSFTLNPLCKKTPLPSGNGFNFSSHLAPPVDRQCEHCGKGFHIAGPVWNGPIHDAEFVKQMLSLVKESPEGTFGTCKRMEGMLTVISEELDVPLYYTLSGLASTIRSSTPGLISVFSALLHKGFQVSVSHAMPSSLKTDAPNSVIWDIMRSWVKKNPVVRKNISEDCPGIRILDKEPSFDADFSRHPKAEAPSRKVKLVRYQENPTSNWGPKSRAGGGKGDSAGKGKRKREDVDE